MVSAIPPLVFGIVAIFHFLDIAALLGGALTQLVTGLLLVVVIEMSDGRVMGHVDDRCTHRCEHRDCSALALITQSR